MSEKYRIIDSHCHIYPDKIAQKASDATGRFYELPASLDGKISTLLEHGEKAGIDLPTGSVLSGFDSNTNVDILPERHEKGAPFSGHFHVIEDVYEVIANGKEPIIKPEETINVAGIIEAFYKSAELGRPVAFDEL